MNITTVWERYDFVRTKAYNYLYSLVTIKKILLSLSMACLTGLAAQVRIYLPFTPIPITGQTFAVLLSGVVLGSRFGGYSQMFYVLLGIAGVPWFTGFRGGFSVLLEPSFGYIVGFIFAAAFIGHFTEKYVQSRRMFPQVSLMIAGILIIYAFGAMYFRLILGTNWQETFFMAVLPFILVDIIKAVLAAGVSTLILPKG